MRRSETWTADDEMPRAGEGPVKDQDRESLSDEDFASGETALRRIAVAEASTKETLPAAGGSPTAG